MKSNITVLTLILLSPLIAYSQVILGEMRLEPVPEGQGIFYIVRNEEVAILIVHSKIPVMSFDCNMGIIRVDNPDPGEYRLHLHPGANIITFKAEGYQPLKKRFYIEQKNYEEVRVEIEMRPPDKGTFIIETIPPGATVIYNSIKQTDKTPSTLSNQPSGHHTIHLELEGYLPKDTLIVCEKDKSLAYKFNLIKNIALLTVESDPSRARIYLNQEYAGATPIRRKEVTPGTYQIKLQKEQYEDYQTEITLVLGDTAELNPRLVKLIGSLTLECEPPEAQIYLDGKLLGSSPQKLQDLAVGKYKALFKMPEYADYEATVEVFKNQESKVTARLSKTAYLKKLKRQRTAQSLSLFLPGSGQIYSGQGIKGFLYFSSFLASGYYASEYYRKYDDTKPEYETAKSLYYTSGNQVQADVSYEELHSIYQDLRDYEQMHKLLAITTVGIWAWNVLDCYLWGGGRAVTYSENPGEGKIMMLASGNKIGIYLRF